MQQNQTYHPFFSFNTFPCAPVALHFHTTRYFSFLNLCPQPRTNADLTERHKSDFIYHHSHTVFTNTCKKKKVAHLRSAHINAICGFTVWERKKTTLNFRSPKEILTSEKIIVIFSDVCAAVRVYLGCRCLAVCLRRCILVEEWVSGPVCFHEPTDRQMSKTGLTRVLKHQVGETSNGGQLKHRFKVQPPSANLHNNQTRKLVQSVNQPLPDRNLRSVDYSASLISQTLANAVWRAVCTDFGWKIHAGHLKEDVALDFFKHWGPTCCRAQLTGSFWESGGQTPGGVKYQYRPQICQT